MPDLPAGRPYLLWRTVPQERRAGDGIVGHLVVYAPVDPHAGGAVEETARVPCTTAAMMSLIATLAENAAHELRIANPPP